MTVTSTNQKVSFSGNGSTTVFAYNFKIFAQTDLLVILRSATGTETTQQLTSNYTVSGVGATSGGNVTMGVAPPSGTTLVIQRVQPQLQGLDLVPNDPFPAQSMEDALDKLVFNVQTLNEEVGRAIKASTTNTIGNTEFTISATDRANKLFSFDSSGNLNIAQELGTYKGNWGASTAYAVRDLVKDTSTGNIFICVTAHTSSGSQPITTNTDSAKWALIVDAASATTSASTATTKANEAAASAVLASQWAIKTDDTVDGTNFSAKYWATSSDVVAVAGKATEIGLLANSTTIGNMGQLGTSAVVEDMGLLATSAVIEDMGLLANSAVIEDMGLLATSAVIEDMGLLATSAVIEDMGLLATSAVISDMSTLAGSGATPTLTSIGVSGNIDVDGIANLDVIDVDGAANFAADLTLADGADIITASAGTSNFRVGVNAGNSIASGGNYNVIVGDEAGTAISTGDGNVSVGYQSLAANTTADESTAVGYQAGYNSTGQRNAFFGSEAGESNTSGQSNSYIGRQAGTLMTTGSKNSILGAYNGNQGSLDIRTSSNNIVLSDGDGNPRIMYITGDGLRLNALSSGSGNSTLKYHTSTGVVTYDTSSERFKQNIVDSKYGLSHVLQLQSRQYEFINDGKPDIGLIAEEVNNVIPELVGKDDADRPMSVAYDRFVSVLVKAIQEQQATITALTDRITALEGA